ncbi:Mannose-1-phosphate guanylyltransferase 1 [compost metagenome]
MEKTEHAVMVPLDVGWSDIGSWTALSDVTDGDAHGNIAKGDVLTEQVSNTYIHAESRLVAAVGVDDLVIVETKDAVLVAHKSKVQDVKKIVDSLKADNRQEHAIHREVYRPWGVYDSIDNGDRYQVKRITVKPGAKLSLQMHHHRAEHWIVVSGTAQVTNGDKTYLVTENQSTYIPVGQTHSLENPGVIPLELIEVQSGSYLGEDDIVRFEDKYGRI